MMTSPSTLHKAGKHLHDIQIAMILALDKVSIPQVELRSNTSYKHTHLKRSAARVLEENTSIR